MTLIIATKTITAVFGTMALQLIEAFAVFGTMALQLIEAFQCSVNLFNETNKRVFSDCCNAFIDFIVCDCSFTLSVKKSDTIGRGIFTIVLCRSVHYLEKWRQFKNIIVL